MSVKAALLRALIFPFSLQYGIRCMRQKRTTRTVCRKICLFSRSWVDPGPRQRHRPNGCINLVVFQGVVQAEGPLADALEAEYSSMCAGHYNTYSFEEKNCNTLPPECLLDTIYDVELASMSRVVQEGIVFPSKHSKESIATTSLKGESKSRAMATNTS